MPVASRQDSAAVVPLSCGDAATGQVVRINSEELLQNRREVEIEHQGRIYTLRRTQLNKLILTA